MFLSVISQILKLSVNILTIGDKYSLQNKENLWQPIQMQISKKQKKFLNFLLYFWNLSQILDNSKEKWPS